jgi:hypothetical protein
MTGRTRFTTGQKPAPKLTVDAGKGEYSLDAAAHILRITPAALRAHMELQGRRVPAYLDETDLRELWHVFRR